MTLSDLKCPQQKLPTKIFIDDIERIYSLCGYLESEKLEGRKALYHAISRGFFSYEDFITITEFTPHITIEIAKWMGKTVNEIRIMTMKNNLTIKDVLVSITKGRQSKSKGRKQMKPRDLKCFEQVASVIGEELAEYELQRVIDCEYLIDPYAECVTDAFDLDNTPQGVVFWRCFFRAKNPYEYGYEKPKVKEWGYINGEWMENIFGGFYLCGKRKTWMVKDMSKILARCESVIMPDWNPLELEAYGKAWADKYDNKAKNSNNQQKEPKGGVFHSSTKFTIGKTRTIKAVDLFNKLYNKDITEDQAKALLILIEYLNPTTQTPPQTD